MKAQSFRSKHASTFFARNHFSAIHPQWICTQCFIFKMFRCYEYHIEYADALLNHVQGQSSSNDFLLKQCAQTSQGCLHQAVYMLCLFSSHKYYKPRFTPIRLFGHFLGLPILVHYIRKLLLPQGCKASWNYECCVKFQHELKLAKFWHDLISLVVSQEHRDCRTNHGETQSGLNAFIKQAVQPNWSLARPLASKKLVLPNLYLVRTINFYCFVLYTCIEIQRCFHCWLNQHEATQESQETSWDWLDMSNSTCNAMIPTNSALWTSKHYTECVPCKKKKKSYSHVPSTQFLERNAPRHSHRADWLPKCAIMQKRFKLSLINAMPTNTILKCFVWPWLCIQHGKQNKRSFIQAALLGLLTSLYA